MRISWTGASLAAARPGPRRVVRPLAANQLLRQSPGPPPPPPPPQPPPEGNRNAGRKCGAMCEEGSDEGAAGEAAEPPGSRLNVHEHADRGARGKARQRQAEVLGVPRRRLQPFDTSMLA
ncbi:hypothetical protein PLESTB_001533600 [Pleodorina starrii]|uniref:Uncharacterized protein n=1 Tax=Pleodorina starrii TaxID=330485 RepID=A0A9W6BWZ8_9CHLO|nr:hypothetical protein PLESTB_001533600 [Pleodorina starrii]